MNTPHKPSRRKILKSGLAAAAAATVVTRKSYAESFKKKPGETKIVCVMGDYWHPAASQESHVRSIFSSKKDFKVHFVLSSRYLTAELLSDADLLITARYGGGDAPAWTPDPIVVERPRGDRIWTDEHIEAIYDNVKNRGMGWLAAHCSLFSGRKEIEDLMGIEPLLHQEIQPLVYRDFNQDHPITKGFDTFFTNLEEQFDVQIKDPSRTTILFKSIAVHDKRLAVNGWCLEQGNGRVVGLLPGHYQWTYRIPEYQEIFWRAAHWAMKRDIPPYPSRTAY